MNLGICVWEFAILVSVLLYKFEVFLNKRYVFKIKNEKSFNKQKFPFSLLLIYETLDISNILLLFFPFFISTFTGYAFNNLFFKAGLNLCDV